MRTVTHSDTVKIKVKRSELLEKEWIYFKTLTSKLREIENEKGMTYKALCNNFYNSRACGEYNVKEIVGLPCISVKSPMKGTASLTLEFEVTE